MKQKTNAKLEEAKKVVASSKRPVDITFVAERLGVGWGTARYLLLCLVARGDIKGIECVNSWVFSCQRDQSQEPAQEPSA